MVGAQESRFLAHSTRKCEDLSSLRNMHDPTLLSMLITWEVIKLFSELRFLMVALKRK